MASYGLGSYWGAVVMRARRAASLALIAVVLIHTSILTTGLSNTSGRLASVTPAPSLPAMIVNTGTTVASSRATETISWSQRAADPRAVNVSPVLGEGWDALAFSPGGWSPSGDVTDVSLHPVRVAGLSAMQDLSATVGEVSNDAPQMLS